VSAKKERASERKALLKQASAQCRTNVNGRCE
jgi:hypothetical protein